MRNEIARCLHGGMLGLGRHLRGVGKKEGPRDNNRRLIDSARARVAGHASLSLAVASSTNNDDDDGNNMNHMNERAQNVTMGTPATKSWSDWDGNNKRARGSSRTISYCSSATPMEIPRNS